MINVTIFTISGFVYLFSAVLYGLYLATQKKDTGRLSTFILTGGIALQTTGYAVRWYETVKLGFDQTPLNFFTLYESFIFAAWIMALTYLFFEYQYSVRILGAVIAPFVSLLMLLATYLPVMNPAIQELPSVLRGNLFTPHAIASTAAFSAFIFSVIVSSVILVIERRNKVGQWLHAFRDRQPDVKVLDELNYRAIAIGFFLYTIGMATGAYRCKIIWGKYWSWDPSEVSSLAMWLMYAFVLHGRYQRWWGPRMTGALAITAFIVSVLCFLISASFLLISRHYPIT